MQVETEKNYKKFQIIDGDKVLVKGIRPKWYSSEIRFFHNNKTYEIKKKRFWSTSFILLESGRQIGNINWNFKSGFKIVLKHSPSNLQYWLKKEKAGKWYESDRDYILCENGETPVLTIHYTLKKWKEHIEVEFEDKDNADYVLLICALFSMKQQQLSENAAASGGFS